MPQLLENFSGLMPSTLFIESTPHVDVLRRH
uniref:Uncharacterized protein n=1 Tax=Rhizophora mucronata TaxID=61149 RepID=A0A2P2PI03_RHIMU